MSFYKYLSKVSSSSMLRSHAMYSNAASVILGHQLRSSARSFWRFSAINSTPSSVILLHPERESTVKCGKECTRNSKRFSSLITYTHRLDCVHTYINNAMICELPTRGESENAQGVTLFWREVRQRTIRYVVSLK